MDSFRVAGETKKMEMLGLFLMDNLSWNWNLASRELEPDIKYFWVYQIV